MFNILNDAQSRVTAKLISSRIVDENPVDEVETFSWFLDEYEWWMTSFLRPLVNLKPFSDDTWTSTEDLISVWENKICCSSVIRLKKS